MCGSIMVDIQSATAENMRAKKKKEEEKTTDDNTIQYNIKTCNAPYVTRMLTVGLLYSIGRP